MMERKNRLEYLQLRDSGKSLQEIADMFGVSKQRVHEVLSEKSKRENRTELRQEINQLQAELQRLQQALTAAEERERGLRQLAGRAADAIGGLDLPTWKRLESLADDLRREAKGEE